ncbi:hypothetical protein Barb6_02976 [Bacteroidales bacterium Barb6]|nr:hypothetical protein Barb6_02976 [Bacteroidales bacterium Barb6]
MALLTAFVMFTAGATHAGATRALPVHHADLVLDSLLQQADSLPQRHGGDLARQAEANSFNSRLKS